ncbi:hypothetical protein M3204_13980 [Mesobacillus subterraneus]|uniref:hypothetical protein n=1 Tax=Mesobacillus subterraneus TaxID=285983 RepID=UPI00203A3EE3|nr:hypothetical protein [Mesobacillus subterraneus]MCM3665522.1 hypothetical protein [Mesobacillus subterraneus]MCM3686081.1 hypothetical protein [Mesobacillus subterraneus]
MADMRESNKRSIGQLTVDIDCSDALKGLKAITREAKKATEALKELEEQRRKLSGQHVHTITGSISHDQEILSLEFDKVLKKQMDRQRRNQGITY